MTSKSTSAEVERQLDVIRDGAVDCYGEEELRTTLAEAIEASLPLRVKLGMDPSAPDLHLGHTVVLQKLRRFQDLGHTPIFLIGDFTARIGDPSGKKKTRPALDPAEVAENAQTYVEQAGLVLDVERAEIRFNSEWMDRMSPSDFVRLCSHGTVARLLERDDFSKRYGAGEPIAVHEFLYPFVQAYDSVALESNIELGGTDQTFNLLMAREVQRDYGQRPQAVITHPLLVGLDGSEKMSKSLGNTIGITDAPEDVYGKLMSISDALMLDYFDVLKAGEWGDLAPERERLGAGAGDPLAFKRELARRVVDRFNPGEGERAAEHFRRVITRKQVPDDIPETAIDVGETGDCGLIDILEATGLVASRNEARRLVTQKAVQLDGERVADPLQRLGPGAYLLKIGKRRFARIRLG
ncbi:MAG: tyrosine--tRNA ligase [Deltaproteobacteria bacterium]|nr:tyrosine--tRNA ligase [Deltaproteobacteria bacterium]MBW2666864.1 tyrosine--tRNA ligase [Deltaproteobacteria bacterium]